MSITNRLKVTISPIRLHSASSLQIPRSTARFNALLPTVNVSPLKLHSVSSINLYGASNYNIFSNHLRIRLSPIKSPILLKYKNPYKRNSMYPNISKLDRPKGVLKTRFKERLLKIKKAKKIDTFLYQHFRSTGH